MRRRGRRPGGPAVRPLNGVVAVPDSKDPAGPALAFTPAAWRAFVAELAERA
ncbi:DUF397 domain-containing protein [Micromonospora sp. DT46]|uniref:DUF397 domain-containing protein n=1 Tax=unclassified Micromonospora TaxID=2617518 RepID=UPI00124B4A04|nr:DUF397 domain-containing protein [Micromonospora sp. AMSO12t]